MHGGQTDSKHVTFLVQPFSQSTYSTDVPCHSPEDVCGRLNSIVSQHLKNELAFSQSCNRLIVKSTYEMQLACYRKFNMQPFIPHHSLKRFGLQSLYCILCWTLNHQCYGVKLTIWQEKLLLLNQVWSIKCNVHLCISQFQMSCSKFIAITAAFPVTSLY